MGLNERLIVYGMIIFLGLVVFGVIDKDRLMGKTEAVEVAEEEPEVQKIEDAEFATVTVRALRVVTPDGKLLVEAGVDDESGTGFVSVANATGAVASRVGADSEGAGVVSIHRKDGQRAAQLAIRFGSGNLLLENEKALPVVTLGGTPKKGSVLQLAKEDGTVITSVHAGPDGGEVVVRNAEGKNAAAVTSVKGAGVVTVSSGGKTVAALKSDDLGGAMTLYGSDGRALLKARIDKDGGIAAALNRNNRVVSLFGVTKGGAGFLSARDMAGETRALVSGGTSGGFFTSYNDVGKKCIIIGPTTKHAGLITLHDKEGAKFVELHAGGQHGGLLTLFDTKKNICTSLGAASKGGVLNLNNRTGKRAAFLGATSDSERGRLMLYSARSKLGAQVIASDTGGYLQVYNAQEKVIANIGGSTIGRGVVQVLHANGKVVAELKQGNRGGSVWVATTAGKLVAQMSVDSKTGVGFFQTRDRSGTILSEMASNDTGGYLTIHHRNGKSAGRLGVKGQKGYCVTRRYDGTQSDVMGLR